MFFDKLSKEEQHSFCSHASGEKDNEQLAEFVRTFARNYATEGITTEELWQVIRELRSNVRHVPILL